MLVTHQQTWLTILIPSVALAASFPRAVAEDALQDICGAHSSRVALAADTLFFTGGRYTFKDGNTESSGIDSIENFFSLPLLNTLEEPYLYSLPLNASFPVDGVLPSNSYNMISSPGQWGSEGAFFQDANETMLYSVGGYVNDQEDPRDTLNAYNLTSGQWSKVTVSGGNFNYNSRRHASSAVTRGSSEALGFIAGGDGDWGGMIRFDASDPAKPQWQNETDNEPPRNYEGGMEFIRLGPKGSLISFGGYNQDNVYPDRKWAYEHRPMREINVYDIDSATWFTVQANGEIPSNRSAFCTAVSSAPDDSSFQITIYGGWQLFRGHSFAETYVLSIPSFRWINVTDPTNLEAPITPNGPIPGRDHHKCVAYKDRQMLVLGGILRTGEDKENMGSCDNRMAAVRALDLSTFQWNKNWNDDPAPYFVPEAVTRIIGGNGQGQATMRQPEAVFNDSKLETIFSQVLPRYTPPVVAAAAIGSSGDNKLSSEGDGGADGTSSGVNVGAIAGGVTGGVCALAIIAAAIFLLRRRRRTTHQRVAESVPAIHYTKPELDDNQQIPQDEPAPEYYKPLMTGPRSGWVGGAGGVAYNPVSQHIDTGYRRSEVDDSNGGMGMGMGRGTEDRTTMGELPA